MPELTDSAVEKLVPLDEPSALMPEFVPREFFAHRLERFELPLTRRIFQWVTAFQALAERRGLERNFPGFQFATYGFVPTSPNVEVTNRIRVEGGYVFGIALELEPIKESPFQEVEWIQEGDLIIPCVLNRRRTYLDVANPVVPRGTGACWAHSGKAKINPAADGVLTAEHVVAGLPLTSQIPMSDPGTWYLGDRGSSKIDAALIVQKGCIPSSAAKLAVEFNPLSNTNVQIHGAATGTVIPAKITHAMVHPTYLSDRHPMRVFLDSYGIPGDSGALVKDTKTGHGIGIYMGRDPVPPALGAPPVYEGVAQALSQAQYALQLDLFI